MGWVVHSCSYIRINKQKKIRKGEKEKEIPKMKQNKGNRERELDSIEQQMCPHCEKLIIRCPYCGMWNCECNMCDCNFSAVDPNKD